MNDIPVTSLVVLLLQLTSGTMAQWHLYKSLSDVPDIKSQFAVANSTKGFGDGGTYYSLGTHTHTLSIISS